MEEEPSSHLLSATTFLLTIAVAIMVWMAGQNSGWWGKRGGENMMVGAHWIQAGTYGHTPDTLPTYDYSGYYSTDPTPPWA